MRAIFYYLLFFCCADDLKERFLYYDFSLSFPNSIELNNYCLFNLIIILSFFVVVSIFFFYLKIIEMMRAAIVVDVKSKK